MCEISAEEKQKTKKLISEKYIEARNMPESEMKYKRLFEIIRFTLDEMKYRRENC